jgi:hypothetical protein
MLRRPLLFDRGANRPHVSAGIVHQHRVTRDIYADRSPIAVGVPFDDVAFGVAPFDEAGFVVRVSRGFAATITGHVLEDLRVLRREFVNRARHIHGPPRREARIGDRRHRHRQRCPRWGGLLDFLCRRGGRLFRWALGGKSRQAHHKAQNGERHQAHVGIVTNPEAAAGACMIFRETSDSARRGRLRLIL